MFVLFDEAAKLTTGRLMAEADASVQVELDTGKRVKVKNAHVLMRFAQPSPSQLLAQAQALLADMELDLAWEFAPEDEFDFVDLAQEYFSKPASLDQQLAALLCLMQAPHYFRRGSGKGRFKKASAELVQQALAALAKKQQQQAQIEQWAQQLVQGQCPQAVAQQLYKILFKPDKNALEYKAVALATQQAQMGVLPLLKQAGAIASAYQFHWQRFLFDQFPKGTAFAPLQAPEIDANALPLANVQAYSIDDSSTTEIDDALSVQGLGTGQVTLGIHIAAPGLAIEPDGAIDQVARQRLSTVYMPGHKLTMLPDDVVQHYTLQEGRACPAVSLYVVYDEETLAVVSTQTQLERVFIAHNLRHDQLDDVLPDAFFAAPDWPQALATSLQPNHPAVAWGAELRMLHRLALHLKAQREVVRGKPETFNRPDYGFSVQGAPDAGPVGDEEVRISVRRRGSPLDLIVAEAMIVANSTWGQWLASTGVPGIYRSQASMAPGMKVRMGTRALPHAGMGVPCYAWSTSPLRRYTDLVNQWQIIACAKHGATAALAAPFKPKDAMLMSIISSFETTYAAYNGFQNGMERYWTLQYLRQNGITELVATTMKDQLVRADDLPLVFSVVGADALPRQSKIRVRLGDIDDIALDVSGTLIERLDADASDEQSIELSEEDEAALAGPLTIEVDAPPDATTPSDQSSQGG